MRRTAFLVIPLLLAAGCLKQQALKQEVVQVPPPAAVAAAPRDTAPALPPQPRLLLTPVYFEYDSTRITDDARARLDALADTLRARPGIALRIEGHCDDHGSDRYNFALAGGRALAVRDYLTARGVAAPRLLVASIGKQRPASLDTTDAGRARNRRAEFVVLPISNEQ